MLDQNQTCTILLQMGAMAGVVFLCAVSERTDVSLLVCLTGYGSSKEEQHAESITGWLIPGTY